MKPGGSSGVPDPLHVAEILPAHLPDGLLSIAGFGPGRGEAIVVRLPDGSVGVVDGCREPKNGNATGKGDPVRELLNQLKPARLAFVCLTHGHDDHYPGLGRLLDAFKNRVDHIWRSSNMTDRHAQALINWVKGTRGGKIALPDAGDVVDLERVITTFNEAYEHYGAEPHLLVAGQSLLQVKTPLGDVTIDACGPSSRDLLEGEKSVAKALEAQSRGDGAKGKFDLNVASGAVLIRWGSTGVLLAGDLVQGNHPNAGWRHCSRHVNGPVQVVNVAHHASLGAHHSPLWRRMNPQLAIITPFMNAIEKHPPRPRRIAKLVRSCIVAITSPPKWKPKSGFPQPLVPIGKTSGFGPKNKVLPSIAKPVTDLDIRNAVAVSLDHTGTIKQFVLAGQARVYDIP
jgi:beta-lactamase superfamily II metal-dependent hydrolase